MAWLDVPTHLQDDPTLCGPACAQMVSRYFELSSGSRNHIRDQRSFDGGPGSWAFATSPAQLAQMINSALSPGAARYQHYATETAAEALEIAAASVDAGYPAVMLVDDGDHWDVLNGYTSLGVHVRNPAPDRTSLYTSTAPPPHHDGDDGCATLGNSVNQTRADGDELYTVAGWLRRTYKPCRFEDPLWYGKYVVVAREHVTPVTPRAWAPPKRSQAIQASDIRRLALEALYQSDLLVQRPGWRDFDVQRSESHHLLVEAERGASYYLVAVRNDQGRSVLVGLDSATGELLWARLNPTRRTLEHIDRATSNRARWTARLEWGFSPFLPDVETGNDRS